MKRYLRDRAMGQDRPERNQTQSTGTPGGEFETPGQFTDPGGPDGRQLERLTQWARTRGLDEHQTDNLLKMETYRSDLFQIITTLEIKDCNKLNIHKGKDPSVELVCHGEAAHKVKLLFPGDMERQKFIEAFIERQRSDGQESEEEEKEQAWDGQDSEDGAAYISDEEPVPAVLYD